jgi:ferritin
MKKSKSNVTRSSLPRFQVEGSVPRKRVNLNLKVTAAELISEYAKYLSNQGGYTVTSEAIVERLTEELTRDKHFNAYLELQSARLAVQASSAASHSAGAPS